LQGFLDKSGHAYSTLPLSDCSNSTWGAKRGIVALERNVRLFSAYLSFHIGIPETAVTCASYETHPLCASKKQESRKNIRAFYVEFCLTLPPKTDN